MSSLLVPSLTHTGNDSHSEIQIFQGNSSIDARPSAVDVSGGSNSVSIDNRTATINIYPTVRFDDGPSCPEDQTLLVMEGLNHILGRERTQPFSTHSNAPTMQPLECEEYIQQVDATRRASPVASVSINEEQGVFPSPIIRPTRRYITYPQISQRKKTWEIGHVRNILHHLYLHINHENLEGAIRFGFMDACVHPTYGLPLLFDPGPIDLHVGDVGVLHHTGGFELLTSAWKAGRGNIKLTHLLPWRLLRNSGGGDGHTSLHNLNVTLVNDRFELFFDGEPMDGDRFFLNVEGPLTQEFLKDPNDVEKFLKKHGEAIYQDIIADIPSKVLESGILIIIVSVTKTAPASRISQFMMCPLEKSPFYQPSSTRSHSKLPRQNREPIALPAISKHETLSMTVDTGIDQYWFSSSRSSSPVCAFFHALLIPVPSPIESFTGSTDNAT